MALFNAPQLTPDGIILNAKAQTGVQLKFTKVVLGDGASISHNVLLGSQPVLDSGWARLDVVWSNTTPTGFFLQRVSVYAQDPNVGEIEYSRANAQSGMADWVPGVSSSSPYEVNLSIYSRIDNATNVTAQIGSASYVTQQDLDNRLALYVLKVIIGQPNGVASLDGTGKVPASQLPAMDYIPTSQKGTANGVAPLGADSKVPAANLPLGTANGAASLGADGKVPVAQIPALDYIPTSQKGAANGVASLGADGKLTASQLPTIAAIGVSNPNMLHNWDFRNLYRINQRVLTGTITYVAVPSQEIPIIDRWRLTSGSVTLVTDGLTLNGTIIQMLEQPAGAGCIASVEMASGTASASYSDGLRTYTITSSGGTVRKAKLERGTVSTLANDPSMDPASEFIKCARYQLVLPRDTSNSTIYIGADYWTANTIPFLLPTPNKMFAWNPTINSGALAVCHRGSSVAISGFAFSAAAYTEGVTITATKNNHGVTDAILSIGMNSATFEALIIECLSVR